MMFAFKLLFLLSSFHINFIKGVRVIELSNVFMEQKCEEGFFWDPFNKTCKNIGPDEASSSYQEHTRQRRAGGISIPIPPLPVSGSMRQCEEGFVWDSISKMCKNHGPDDVSYQEHERQRRFGGVSISDLSRAKLEERRQCEEGFVWDSISKNCKKFIYSEFVGAYRKSYLRLPRSLAKPFSTRRENEECEGGYVRNPFSHKCMIPPPGAFSSSYREHARKRRAAPNPLITPLHFGNIGRKQECEDGSFWDIYSNKCIELHEFSSSFGGHERQRRGADRSIDNPTIFGEEYRNNEIGRKPECKEGTLWDPYSEECKERVSSIHPSSFRVEARKRRSKGNFFSHTLDTKEGRIQMCEEDSFWDPFSQRCSKRVCITEGYVIRNGMCVPESQKCEEGFLWDPHSKECKEHKSNEILSSDGGHARQRRSKHNDFSTPHFFAIHGEEKLDVERKCKEGFIWNPYTKTCIKIYMSN